MPVTEGTDDLLVVACRLEGNITLGRQCNL